MHKQSPIGIFDSGLGGISVLSEIHSFLPKEDLLFLGDSKYNPYGTKTKAEITERCIAICDWFMAQDVKAIVIACNTATSACVDVLRKRYPIDIIGMEPALKVACEIAPDQKIAVWATNYTLKEKKFANLMHRFDQDYTILRVPCPKLVELVEKDALDQSALIKETLEGYLAQSQAADSIVLGCTHFVFYRKMLENLVSKDVHIVDGNAGTARHCKDVLAAKNLLNDAGGNIEFHNTLPEKIALSQKLLNELEEEL